MSIWMIFLGQYSAQFHTFGSQHTASAAEYLISAALAVADDPRGPGPQRRDLNTGLILGIYGVGDCRKPDMTIGADYPIPVQVNGYLCRNCTDLDLAKKHIDPEHPRSGPYGINAKNDPTVEKTAVVIFGGALSGLNTNSGTTDSQTISNLPSAGSHNASGTAVPGVQLDLLA